MIRLKNNLEIEYLKKSNRIIAEIFELLKKYIRVGITTKELDKIAEDYILSKGARPSFKGYTPGVKFPKYPNATCTSVNEQVIHGIPGNYSLKNGDIISIDIGTELAGYFGDSAVTYLVGDVSNENRYLVEHTKKSLELAIEVCREDHYLYEIGKEISFYLEPKGYGVIRDYCGHGVGFSLHEDPPVINYYDPKKKGPRLKKGMVLAIEPMVTLGNYQVKTLSDQWTVVTIDGKNACHWEHSIVITDGDPIVLSSL